MKNSFAKKIKRFEKVLIVFVALIIFLGFFYYIFLFLDMKPKQDDGGAVIVTDEYQEYRDSISGTNKGVKALLENKQLNNLEFYESDLDPGALERSSNPFVKSF